MVGLTVWGLFLIGKRDSEWKIYLSPKQKGILIFSCILMELSLALLCHVRHNGTRGSLICFDIFAGCLIAACVMDIKEKTVYRFVWAVAFIALAGCGCMEGVRGSVTEYLVFVLLQQGIFAKLYGKADCYAFSVCGIIWMLKGETFANCVFHMAVSFALLTYVQLLRGNVSKTGRLKEPVAMLPYIVLGFWIRFGVVAVNC